MPNKSPVYMIFFREFGALFIECIGLGVTILSMSYFFDYGKFMCFYKTIPIFEMFQDQDLVLRG